MKALKIAGVAIAVLVVAAAALLVIGIPSGLVTPLIQARIERETGYRIAIAGATRLGFWPLKVTIHDITLSDPSDRELTDRLRIGSVEAAIPLHSMLTGQLQISELTIVRPVLRVPLWRERSRRIDNSARATSSSSNGGARSFPVFHVSIADGTIAFTNPRDRVENRIEGIDAEATSATDRQVDIAGSARLGEHPLKFAIKATAPAVLADRQNVPLAFTIDAPGLLQQSLSGKAEARLNGPVLMINGLSGTFGDSQFNGWASADLASKPLVKVDLDFQRLDFAKPSWGKSQPLSPQASQGPWSDAKIDLSGLNYVDAQLRISAAELGIGDARFAPAAMDATLGSGVMKATFSHLGVYGGEADGELGVDATGSSPAFTLRADLNGVQALPLLSNVADFHRLDGKMQAKIGVGASGDSPRAVLGSLDIGVRQFPGRRHPRHQYRQNDPVAHVKHAVGMAGSKRSDHRPVAAQRFFPSRTRPGDHQRSRAGRPPGADERRRHDRSRQQINGLSSRTETRHVHRGTRQRHQLGRPRHSRCGARSLECAGHLSRHCGDSG